MKKKGFTLIELLAVIVILGIVIAIAIPGVNAVINNSRKTAFKNELVLLGEGLKNELTAMVYTFPSASPTTCHILMTTVAAHSDRGGDKSTFDQSWAANSRFIFTKEPSGNFTVTWMGKDAADNGLGTAGQAGSATTAVTLANIRTSSVNVLSNATVTAPTVAHACVRTGT